MRVFILGGTSFVGRAMVDAFLAAGHDVSALNRGTAPMPPQVRHVPADRNDPAAVADALADVEVDWVVDVSGYTPAQVRPVATSLADRADRYLLVSTVSVFPDFPFEAVGPQTEPVAADPDDDGEPDLARYGEQKRGAELVVLEAFGADRTLLHIVRAGIEQQALDRQDGGEACSADREADRELVARVDELEVAVRLGQEVEQACAEQEAAGLRRALDGARPAGPPVDDLDKPSATPTPSGAVLRVAKGSLPDVA